MNSIQSTPLTDATLAGFEKLYASQTRKAGGTFARAGSTFAEWYLSRPPGTTWKVSGWVDEEIYPSRNLRRAVAADGVQTPEDWMALATRNEACVNDYILCVDVTEPKRANAEWFFVTHLVKVPESDSAYYPKFPYQVGQAHPLRMYRSPPFKIDKRFQSAVRAVLKPMNENQAIVELGMLKVRTPSVSLLNSLYHCYETGTT